MTDVGRRGFTLIEIAVSLVIAGIVVAGTYQAAAITMEARARVLLAGDDVVRSAGARELLSTWLHSAVLPAGVSPFRETPEDGWNSESVVFQVADGGPLFPGARTIRLWIERDPGRDGGLIAGVSRRPGEDGAPLTLLLEPTAERLSLRYWGTQDGTQRWVDEWLDPEALPNVVELQLSTAPRVRIGPEGAETRDLPPLLRLPLRIPLALGGA